MPDRQIEVPEKFWFLYNQHARYKIAYGGRAGLKSWQFARALLVRGIQQSTRILCAREVQKSIKESVHELLRQQIDLMGMGGYYTALRDEIRGPGETKIVYTGLADKTSEQLKSYEGIDIVWVEEARSVTRRSWDVLLPTIRKVGSEIWMSFNPELDTDETWVRFVENAPEDSIVQETSWRDNPWFADSPAANERKEFLRLVEKGIRDQEDYDNIWEGRTRSAVQGAIYAKEMAKVVTDKRVCGVPYDSSLPVHVIFDLGWNDKMAIIMVQKMASEVRIIDYIEDSHRTLDDYLISQEGREDLESRKYRWGHCVLPHDGDHHSYLVKNTARDICEADGRFLGVHVLPNASREEGIRAVRAMFPRCVFDKQRTATLRNRLARYKRRINAATNEPGAPEHDENSHGSDGFRYLAMGSHLLDNEQLFIDDPYEAFRSISL